MMGGVIAASRRVAAAGDVIADLFSSEQSGAYYDLDDLSLLAQNADGTGAVTADGDPVGYWEPTHGSGTITQSDVSRKGTYRTDGTLRWVEVAENSFLSVPTLTAQDTFMAGVKLPLDEPFGLANYNNNNGFFIGDPGNNTDSDANQPGAAYRVDAVGIPEPSTRDDVYQTMVDNLFHVVTCEGLSFLNDSLAIPGFPGTGIASLMHLTSILTRETLSTSERDTAEAELAGNSGVTL